MEQNSETLINRRELENFFINSNIDIDFGNFFIAILLSLILAYMVKFTYIKVGRALNDKDYFSDTFVPLAIITTLVITVIKFSLALSLGLVGALSIVRFRAAIKEPEELVYLFLAIAIGLGLGANQTIPTVIASPLILGFMAILKRMHHKSANKNLFLTIHLKNNPSKDRLNELSQLVEKHARVLNLRHFSSRENETEATFDIDIKNSEILFDLESDLRRAFSDIEITFIDHNQDPTF